MVHETTERGENELSQKETDTDNSRMGLVRDHGRQYGKTNR